MKLALAMMMLATQVLAASPAEDSFLDKPIGKVEANEGHEFLTICERIKFPCGIEDRYEDSFRNQFRLVTVPGGTPRQMFDGLIRKHPSYEWALTDGSVQVRYVGPLLIANPLDRVIGNFSAKDELSYRAAMRLLKESGIRAGVSWVGDPHYARISIELSSGTVRSALNNIMKADGKVAWQLSISSNTPNNFVLGTWHLTDGESVFPRKKN